MDLSLEALKDLIPFLSVRGRLDLNAISLTHVLSLSGSEDGIKFLCTSAELLRKVFELTSDEAPTIAKDAVLVLVNLTAGKDGAKAVVDATTSEQVVHTALKYIFDKECPLADFWSMVLSNISRPEELVQNIWAELDGKDRLIDRMVSCFGLIGYNKKGAHLNYLGPIFSNLSQCRAAREVFCNPDRLIFTSILPFVKHEESIIRRGGAIGVLKNICFDTSRHEWLLEDSLDLLTYILLPLAGPEEFDNEDTDKLPIQLQFLEPDKKREEDPDLRKMLVECLSQLCATRKGREYLRTNGTYEILREYHKWESNVGKDNPALQACENVVDVLIRTEDEIGEDNLKSVIIPDDLTEKFEKIEGAENEPIL